MKESEKKHWQRWLPFFAVALTVAVIVGGSALFGSQVVATVWLLWNSP